MIPGEFTEHSDRSDYIQLVGTNMSNAKCTHYDCLTTNSTAVAKTVRSKNHIECQR